MKISVFLSLMFSLFPVLHVVHAADESFPFDKPCLEYNKDIFRKGGDLLNVMKEGDFPQYCELYSLENYHISETRDNGYFIVGESEETKVYLKADTSNKVKSLGQWAYFVGPNRFLMSNGEEKEFYVFQELRSLN